MGFSLVVIPGMPTREMIFSHLEENFAHAIVDVGADVFLTLGRFDDVSAMFLQQVVEIDIPQLPHGAVAGIANLPPRRRVDASSALAEGQIEFSTIFLDLQDEVGEVSRRFRRQGHDVEHAAAPGRRHLDSLKTFGLLMKHLGNEWDIYPPLGRNP